MLGPFALSAAVCQAGIILGELWLARWLKQLRWLPVISILCIVLHLAFDQEPFYPRLLPLYLLSAFSFASWLPVIVHPQAQLRTRTLHIIGIVSLCWLLLAVFLPVYLLPFYPASQPSGPWGTSSRVYSIPQGEQLAGYSRGPVYVEVYFPASSASDAEKGTESYPLVLLEPGNVANRQSLNALAQELSSYGMVVFSIDHPDQSLFTMTSRGGIILPERSYLEQALAISSGMLSSADRERLIRPWQLQRQEELHTVLDSIAGLELAPQLTVGDLADESRIGLAGYGIGANAVQEICMSIGCQALALVDDSSASLPVATPRAGPVLALFSEGFLRHSDVELEPWEGPCRGENGTRWTALVEGAGTLGISGLGMQVPLLVRLVDQRSAPSAEALATVNTCVAAYMRYALRGELSAWHVWEACSVPPVSPVIK